MRASSREAVLGEGLSPVAAVAGRDHQAGKLVAQGANVLAPGGQEVTAELYLLYARFLLPLPPIGMLVAPAHSRRRTSSAGSGSRASSRLWRRTWTWMAGR
jgi:hypothetical protein